MANIQNMCGIDQSYGAIWLNTGSWSGVTITVASNTYKELTSLGTNFTLMTPNNDFAMTTDGRLKYTGINTRTFIINANYNMSNSGRLALAVYKNGSLITGAESYEINASSAPILSTTVSLATNDYVSLWAQRLTGTTFTIYQATLGAISVI